MPAVSKAQQRVMAIALHHPSKLHKRNRGLRKMTKSQLREFASTKGLEMSKKDPILTPQTPIKKGK